MALDLLAVATEPKEAREVFPAVKPNHTVTYCRRPQGELLADIHHPGNGSAPVLLFLHGGAWMKGDRTRGDLLEELVPKMRERGIAVMSIDYRLGLRNLWRNQVEDVNAALRWLSATGEKLGLDTRRVAIAGGSAGAHLASLVALHPQSDLKAAVALYGPADMTLEGWLGVQAPPALRGLNQLLERYSPLHHVGRREQHPPFLLVHGDRDRLVPVSQSRQFLARLRAAGAQADILVVEGADHGLNTQGQAVAPEHVAEHCANWVACRV